MADPAKLKFDKCSLFYDAQGCRLHNYTTLAAGGVKMEPKIMLHPPSPRPRGRPRKHTAPAAKTEEPRADQLEAQAPANAGGSARVLDAKDFEENTGGCDIPYIGKDSFGIQQPDSKGVRRDFESEMSGQRSSDPLSAKASSLLRRLGACHWDNCKVTFASRTAFCHVHRALHDGHESERVLSCYADALVVCHGFAVDQACSAGRIAFFAPSSTVSKAARLPAKDGSSRRQRVAQWYQRKWQTEPVPYEDDFDPEELARIRREIAASFPRD